MLQNLVPFYEHCISNPHDSYGVYSRISFIKEDVKWHCKVTYASKTCDHRWWNVLDPSELNWVMQKVTKQYVFPHCFLWVLVLTAYLVRSLTH